MSWLNVNLNESLSNIKGQLTNLASNVLAEATEDQADDDRENVHDLRRKLSEQSNEIKRLQKENSDILARITSNNPTDEWSWEVTESKSETKCQDLNDADLEARIRELEREKNELMQGLEQLDQDCQSTTDKLVAMKDELQTENSGLKLQHQDVVKECAFLKSNIEQEQKRTKVLEFEKASRDAEIQRLNEEIVFLRLEAEKPGAEEERVNVEEYEELKLSVEDFKQQIAHYELELAKLRESSEMSMSLTMSQTPRESGMSENTKQKYVEILIEATKDLGVNIDRWQLGAKIEATEGSIDALTDYKALVETVAKSIYNWKWKCETLQEEMENVKAEKSLLLTEKNNEIDKLFSNSQELTNNLKLKIKELKHYEEECSQLSSNNEALIDQLEQSKQADMTLHTIPEMNEHLDAQLEKCYKRIEQLEQELEKKQSAHIEDLKSQLMLRDKELTLTKESVEEWQANFYKLDDENKAMKVYLETIRKRFKECDSEREILEDRVKLDSENMAEQSLTLETLQEEVETLTASISDLRKANTRYMTENEELGRKVEEAEKEIMDLKEEMTTEIETSLKKDEQMFGLNGTVDSLEQNSMKLKDLVKVLTKENEDLVYARSHYIMQYRQLQKDVAELVRCYKNLKHYQNSDSTEMQELIKEKNVLIARLCKMEDFEAENAELNAKLNEIQSKADLLDVQRVKVQADYDILKGEKDKLQAELEELNLSRIEIIQLVQQKHQESITYHGEIQRLQQLLTIESEKRVAFETQLAELNGSGVAHEDLMAKEKEVEKLSEHTEFLKDKCAHLAEALLTEQSTTKELYAERAVLQEKEANLTRQLESLRQHLIESEEMYTKEIQAAETKCTEMQQKMTAIVEKEKNSSNRFTSANIRANQQVETLQTNLQLVTNQRDELKRKISDLEDQMERQNAALCNLQIVLEQFQREKDKVIFDETERVRRQVAVEKKLQEDMLAKIGDLKNQLAESKEGLKAAVRLSDQVEASKRQVSYLKEEVAKVQQQLVKSEEKNSKLLNQTDGRVDKMLIKNLVIGLVTCSHALNKDQNQILRIISTVLDFNQQDIDKVKLNQKDHSTWFSNLLHPQTLSDRNLSSESLSQAFVKFLEAESKPRALPNLLDATSSPTGETTATGDSASGGNSRKTSVRQSPLLLNEVVLPTFADFAANRNSSSILKDVLKDNSNAS